MSYRSTLAAVGLTMGVLALGALYWFQGDRPLSRVAADQLLLKAVREADRGRHNDAIVALRRILIDHPDHFPARCRLAEACVRQWQPREAADAIAPLPGHILEQRFEELTKLAKLMTTQGFLFEAQPLLQRLNALRPTHGEIRRELLRCHRIAGQNASARRLLDATLRSQRFELSDLMMVSATGRYWASGEDLQFMQQARQRHHDPLILLGYARREIDNGNLSSAVEILKHILVDQPRWLPAQTWLAFTYWQLGLEAEWQSVMSNWNPTRLDDADAWFVWGVWQRQQQRRETAARCFLESLQRNPRHVAACSQLVTTLRELGHAAESLELKALAERMSRLELYCIDVGRRIKEEGVRAIASECDVVGWHDEARAWLNFGLSKWPKSQWPERDESAAKASGLDACHEEAFLTRLRATILKVPYPLPAVEQRDSSPQPSAPPSEPSAVDWRFDETATDLGIEFRFANGLDPNRSRAYMFEFSGPGIGIIDYDRDGWPDLHLTQGAVWPVSEADTSSRDGLFRNLGNGRFASVADAARLGEPGYSQGPAVGDMDGDGFPDVYVCNIGPNRCYRNNGDGTFREVTVETITAGNDWSLSAAWSDFNDDALPDLYVVNYLAGDVFDRACVGDKGRPKQCAPTFFPAADDRLYLNNGDGTFRDATHAADLAVPDGKGMGLVVGRLQDSDSVSLFVANDTTANHLFARTSVSAEGPHFEEIGSLVGVAFGPTGNAQSSMGVAAGDVNGDGQLDLFVTNFIAESSNLFLRRPGGMFEDAANQWGLSAGGFSTEGWGTQFLDVDADGHLDLFVANGHLEEGSSREGRMPPQLFRNRSGKKLELVASSAVGRYFEGTYLGRSVAVWDWNRDGRADLCVSHVSDPVAILTNRTPKHGHGLGVRLVGRQAARDPIGARVTLTTRGQTVVRELVAGDGYAASNERRLHFGLESAANNVDAIVDWGGGNLQTFSGLVVDAEYVLIERHPSPVRLWEYGGASKAPSN